MIVPAYTFPATANVVELCGARAVLVDVDPDTFNIDLAAVAAAVTSEDPRASWPSISSGDRSSGRRCRPPCRRTSRSSRTPRARSARRYRGTPCGALGVAACLSFHPRKIVTTGEGGAVTTDEAGLDAAVRRFRHHGWRTLGDMPAPGFNYRLPDLLCAIGIPQLARLEELLAARERVAGWYTERLEHHVLTPSAADGDRHGWQAYVVQLDRRDDALAALRDCGNRGADRDVGAAPARAVPRARRVSRRRPRLRARARAAVRNDDDRGRRRAGRGGLDFLVSEC